MRRNVWFIFTLVCIVLGLLFTVSCARKTDTIARGTGDMAALSVMEPTKEECPPVAAKEKTEIIEPGQERFVNEDIHFNFDSAALSFEAQEILKRKADWLKEHSQTYVTIEGHCDERGTNEYNLALGDRRAQSAKSFLVDLGIPANRLSTISYGEERPLDPAGNENAWAKNRRVHFLID